MNEQEVLETLALGYDDAEDLINQADPKLKKKFNRLCNSLVEYMKEVRQHFPDACYYTASGGLNVMLGRPHDDNCKAQQQLLALSGRGDLVIGDGDF